jgi:hypothetical protein
MYFKFERDFVEPNIKCIPMVVRLKLDSCGIKLKLSEWSRLTVAEREHLATAPCKMPNEVSQYRKNLQQLVLERTGEHVAEIPVEDNPLWSMTDEVPGPVKEKLTEEGSTASVHDWQQLTELQRFALLKLSRPGHENRNFIKAIKEFNLI